MKKHKVTKEPKAFKHPRLYIRDLESSSDPRKVTVSEAIIVYPDGRPAERTLSNSKTFSFTVSEREVSAIACWFRERMGPSKQVKVLKKFAKQFGVKTYFAGEIK